ncbi:hypothetical protein N2152v2_003023 [Parachlorella kessleri]
MEPQASRGGSPRAVPSGTALYRDISYLATFSSALGDIKDAAIYVKGNVIEWVGEAAALPAEYSGADQDSPLFNWLVSLYPAWAGMSGEDVYVATKLAMAELLLSGCTCSSDHLYIYPNDVTLDDTIRAGREMGMRFHPTRGIMTLGRSKGGLPPDSVVEDTEAALVDAKRLIEAYHDAERYSMVRVGIAPCSPFTVTNDCMVQAAELARQYPAVRLHTHLAENTQDIEFSEKQYGCRPGPYLQSVGWDQHDCWFAHCVMLDEAERKLFAEKGLGVAHCPSSNARLASGIAPVRVLLDSGVNVGLGVDGSASNDSGNLLEEARLALLLQRALRQDVKGLSVREALEIAIKGGAKNLGRDDIGEIAPGFAADFVGWKLTGKVALAGALGDPLTALILCTPGSVDLSVINGGVVVKDGQLLTCNVEELVREHNERSARICSLVGSPDI